MSFDLDGFETQEVVEKTQSRAVKVTFCEDCGSVLVPFADGKVLKLRCENCSRTFPCYNNKVYLNVIKKEGTMNTVMKKRDLTKDPTLERMKQHCPECNNETIHVLFDAPSSRGDDTLRQIAQCTTCRNQLEKVQYEVDME